MSLHRLSHIEVGVPEGVLAATGGFYRDLGLREIAPSRFATADGGEQLRLVAAPRRRLVAMTVGVDDADDLGRVAAGLAKLGVPTEQAESAIATEDAASGIRVTLKIEPRLEQPASPALVTNAPGRQLRLNRRSAVVESSELPRPRKLSHVVTTSPDPHATRRFFTEGLGFQVSDEIAGLGAFFLRCSTDHHNLLVQQGPFSFLHHSAWELDDVDAVGRVAAAMVAVDPARHVWGLGRHAIGSNYFWYLRDPAGNFAECTSDLDVVVDAEAWKVASSAPCDGLAAWGPPVPSMFLAPDDIVAMAQAG